MGDGNEDVQNNIAVGKAIRSDSYWLRTIQHTEAMPVEQDHDASAR